MVNRLELTWTLITVGLITGVAVYSTVLLYHIDALPAHPNEYVVIYGHQWYWQFYYPANNTLYNSTYDPTTNTVSGGALWAAPGSTVQINVTGVDVVHSFNIAGLGVRIDAIPGRVNTFAFNVPNVAPGTQYLIQCTEFCGTFHGTMRSFLVVT
ncbi:MAG: cytochrome c oxidase subunit II [Thermoplasmata archaeon]|nr:cytochrome c oxidase subunit II [Thermoplasmata archaeon]